MKLPIIMLDCVMIRESILTDPDDGNILPKAAYFDTVFQT